MPLSVPSPHPGEVLTALSVSRDGKTLGAIWINGARVLDASTGRVRATFEHRGAWAEDVAFDPAGRILLTAGLDTTARLWSLDGATGQVAPLYHPIEHASGVVRARFAPDGGLLATAQWDGRVILWRLPSGNPARYAIDAGGPSRVAVSPDGRRVLATATNYRGSTMQSTLVRSAADGSSVGPPLRPGGILIDATFSPDGRHVATASARVHFEPGGRAGNVQLWDWSRGERLFDPVPMPSEPRGLAFRPDGGSLAVVCANGLIVLLDPTTGRVVRELVSALRSRPGDNNLLWANGAAVFSPDGRRLATWGLGRTVEVWEVDSSRLLHRLQHDERIHEARFSGDGEALLTASRDNQARVWDLRTGRLEVSPLRHPRLAVRARFIEDDRQIVTLCDDGYVRRWDRQSGRLLAAHDFDLMMPQDFAFAPDHRVLVAAGQDGISVLDWRTGAAIAPCLRNLGVGFWSVRVTDGDDLIASGGDGRLVGYPLANLRLPSGSPAERQRLLAELIAGQRVQETGALVQLTAEEWLDHWQRLGGRDPGALDWDTGRIGSAAGAVPDGRRVRPVVATDAIPTP